MDWKKQFALTAITSTFLCSSSLAGYIAVNGVGTRGETLQAFTGLADDSSAIFYNPAGLTQVKGTEINSGLSTILTNAMYFNTFVNQGSRSQKNSFAPYVFASSDYFKNFVLGMGIYAPFARQSSYVVNAATYNLPLHSTLIRTDFAPTIAFNLMPHLSFGASIVASYIRARSEIFALNERSNGWGFTGQFGFLYHATQTLSLGIDYRGPEKAHLKGHGSLVNVGQGTFTSKLHYPGVLTAGLAWHFLKPLTFTFSYEYEMWHYLQQVQRVYNSPILTVIATNTINGKNVGDFRFGLMYRPNQKNEFRIGYTYAPKSVPVTFIIPAQPDYNINFFSLGYSYYMNKQVRLDLGYQFAYGRQLFSNNPLYPGNLKMRTNFIMLGVDYYVI